MHWLLAPESFDTESCVTNMMRKTRSHSQTAFPVSWKKKASLSAGFYHVTLALCWRNGPGCVQHKLGFTEQEGVDVGRGSLHMCGI